MLRRWIGALAAILILAALFSYAAPQDPLADFRNEDGGITIPGGQLTPGLQRLLFPEPPPDHTYTFARERFSPYPTLSWVAVRHGPDAKGGIVDVQAPPRTTLQSATPPAHSAPAPQPVSSPDADPLQATETWYARNTNDALACGSDLNKDASETQGTAVATHVLDGTYDYWYGSDEARTIEAGNWVVTFWTTTAGGGGPPGKVTVIVERIVKATCGVQQLIVSEEITMSAGTTGSYATTPVAPGQVIVASGEQIIYRFAKTNGSRTVTLRYDFNDANTANTRLVHPDTAPVAPSVTTNAATDVTSSSATLNGNLDSMGSCSSVDASFEWDIDTGAPYANETAPPTTMTGTGPFSFGLTGLDPSTIYYFRAKATGTCGTAYGGELNFTTDAAGSTTAYLVLGDPECVVTAIATDLDCWSSTSGGNGDGLPDGTEACVADANSGAGTGTMDAALTCGTTAMTTTGFTGTIAIAAQTLTLNAGLTHAGGTITITTGTLAAGANAVSITSAFTSTGACSVTSGAMTIGAGGVVTANACTFTVSGNWDSSAGTFTGGTSTVVFSGSGSLAFASTGNFYAVTVDVGTTRTMTTDVRQFPVGGLLTVNGTIDASGARNWVHRYDNATPIVIGGSGSFGTNTIYVAGHQVNWNLPSGTYYSIQVGMGNGIVATAVGNITVNGSITIFYNGNFASSGLSILDMGGFDLTLAGSLSIGFPGPPSRSGALVAGSGTFDLVGVLIREADSYIDFGSSTGTVSETWTNDSASASWDAGTASVTFDSSTGRTMTFAGSNLAEDEFASVSFTGAATFTMSTRDLRAETITVGSAVTLAVGTLDLRFNHLDVDGTMTMDGETVDDIDIDGSAGTILLTDWTAYAITNGIPDIRWTMDPDTASSDIAFTVAGLATTLSVSLYRDDLEVAKADADGIGSWSVSLAGGWSPHEMRIGEPVPGGHTDPRYRAVIVSCTYLWPNNAVHCSAIERIDPRFISTRSWVVDGRVVDGASDASLDYDLGIVPAVPLDRAMVVTYVVHTTGDADVHDTVTVRLDSSWLWAVYGLGFIGALGLVVVRRSERHTGREEPMP